MSDISKTRKVVSLPANAQETLQFAKELYGTSSLSDVLINALSLYIQLGVEWSKGAEVWIKKPKQRSMFRILKPCSLAMAEDKPTAKKRL